jgi:sulfite exporter TauE/SafE
VASFLGGAAFTGLGVSLLMDTQDVAQFQETVMGVLLVMVGLGIIIRGFLLRGRVVA